MFTNHRQYSLISIDDCNDVLTDDEDDDNSNEQKNKSDSNQTNRSSIVINPTGYKDKPQYKLEIFKDFNLNPSCPETVNDSSGQDATMLRNTTKDKQGFSAFTKHYSRNNSDLYTKRQHSDSEEEKSIKPKWQANNLTQNDHSIPATLISKPHPRDPRSSANKILEKTKTSNENNRNVQQVSQKNKRIRFSDTNEETVNSILEQKRALRAKALNKKEANQIKQQSKSDPRQFGKGFSPTLYSPEKTVMTIANPETIPKFGDINTSVSTGKDLFILAILSTNSQSLSNQKFDEEQLLVIIEKIFKIFVPKFQLDSNMRLKFQNFQQYKNVMTTMIMLDTWAQIGESFETISNNVSSADLLMMNQTYSKIEEKHFWNLWCKCAFTNEDIIQDRHQFDNWIVLIRPNEPPASNQAVVLGFVDPLGDNSINNSDNRNRGGNQGPQQKDYQIIHYRIKISKFAIQGQGAFPIECEKLLIKPIFYLKPTLRLIETMALLEQRANFFKSIIQPNYQDCAYENLDNLNPNSNSFKFHEPELYNANQQLTIKSSFNISQLPFSTNKFLLVQGPPGTGKTHTLIGIIKNLFANIFSDKTKPLRILICAPSNGAIDEIGRRLIGERKFLQQYRSKSLKIVRIGQKAQVHAELAKYELDHLINLNLSLAAQQSNNNNVQNDLILKRSNVRDDIIRNADIILSTLTSCHQNAMDMFRDETSMNAIRCLIVDEASQCIEPELLMPLIYHSITKVILIGDPLQLPATVISKKAQQWNFGRSLFERFFIYFQQEVHKGVLPQNPIICLNEQFRMHREICQLPSEMFYESRLKTHPNAGLHPCIRIHPYFVFDVVDTHESNHKKHQVSKTNETEVEFICKLFQQILMKIGYSTNHVEPPPATIGIITFYRAQKRAIQEQFQIRFSKRLLKHVDVNTVDAFQGQERDIIILSCVRAFDSIHGNGSIGFLRSQQRMNVALTRAKSLLCVCLHGQSFENTPRWQHLLFDAQRRKRLFHVTSKITDYELQLLLI